MQPTDRSAHLGDAQPAREAHLEGGVAADSTASTPRDPGVPSVPPPLPPPPPPARAMAGPPPRATAPAGGRGWKIFALVLLALLMVSALANLGSLAQLWLAASPADTDSAGAQLREVTLEPAAGKEKIAVIDVQGIIVGGYVSVGEYNLPTAVEQQLKRAGRDRHVKAVLLRINSPGGEVLAADEVARVLGEFQEKSGKPVVAVMEGMAASGGYYVAAPCRWIVANPLTLTGSIGVIMHGYNYRGLMDKVGVRPQVYKSGRFKNMLSGDRTEEEILPEERQMVQDLIDETFARFKQVIARGRELAASKNDGAGRSLAPDWETFADGRVLSGKQAHDVGFVDELGSFHVAVARARKLAGIEEASLVQYRYPLDFFNLFRLLGQAQSRSLKIDLGWDLPRLEAGRLYFLFLPGFN